MLPKFPEFKKLELTDQHDIEAMTLKYEPYSDFNFQSMWAWNGSGEVCLSDLNSNLVVGVEDYLSDKICYSFLGTQDVNSTVQQLFNFLDQHNLGDKLKLIPEACLNGLDLKKFPIEIDLAAYDYIYDLRELSTYAGNKYGDKRRKINGFLKKYPSPTVRLLDLKQPETKSQVFALYDSWSENKSKPDEYYFLHKEHAAMKKFLETDFQDVICVGAFNDNQLLGYSIFTCLPDKYAICHFAKGNLAAPGIYEYLMRESALVLLGMNCVLLNYQEDLGLPGLRFYKNSFKPVSFLKKYTIARA